MNTTKEDFIHNTCINIISELNLSINQVAEILNLNYDSVWRKQKKIAWMKYLKKDLILIDKFSEEKVKKIMIARRELRELLDRL